MMSLSSLSLGSAGRPSCPKTLEGRMLPAFFHARTRWSAQRAQISTASLQVTRHATTLVKPSATIYSASPASDYFLSNLDLLLLPLTVPVVLSFAADARHGTPVDPAAILKEALTKVLVHYHPLAGRLALDSHGRPSIHCNAQGVSFVHADSNADIADLGNLCLPNSDTLAHLIYPFHPTLHTPGPLLTAQVTRFKCGGFTLGLVFAHCVSDGTGFVNFLTSWGETARGMPLSLPPALDRSFLKARTPLQINYNHTESNANLKAPSSQSTDLPRSDHVLRSYRFTPANLIALRKRALEDGVLPNCTPFEALAGLLWKVRTTAMDIEPEQRVTLATAFDGRLSRSVGFPRGYFGNAVTASATSASASEIRGIPLSHVVKHVQRAIKCMTGDYIRSKIDYLEREGGRLHPSAASYIISNWSRLRTNGIDFGWGKPIELQPASIPMQEVSIILADGEGGKGMNVLFCHSPKILKRMDELLCPHLDPLDSVVS